MKKGVLLGVCTLLLGIGLWSNPIDAKAENYYYMDTQSVSGGDMVTVGKWYKGGIGEEFLMEGMPGEVTYADTISVEAAPDEECLEWLTGLSGDLGNFSVNVGDDTYIQIGSPNTDLHFNELRNNSGNIIVYGDVSSMGVGDSNPRDRLEAVGNMVINGNINYLYLGGRDMTEFPGMVPWNVTVNGNVEEVSWVKSLESAALENTFYLGFNGDVSVSGTVNRGKIQEVVYDTTVSKDTWYVSGELGTCGAGIFCMTDGVLTEAIEVTEYEYRPTTYYYQYQCYQGDGTANKWTKYAYNSETGEFAFLEDCSKEDIPENATVSVFGTAVPETLDRDVASLTIINSQYGQPVEFTLNGNVDELYMEICNKGVGNIEIIGDIESMYTIYRYNSAYNFGVDGKIKDASYAVRRNGTYETEGYFTAEDMQVIIDGEWNPDLFMYTSRDESAVGYVPIDRDAITDALEGNSVGEEVTISTENGEKTLVKAAEVLIEKTAEAVWEQLMQKEEWAISLDSLKEMLQTELEKVKETVPVCAVDINIHTYFAEKDTGDRYEGVAEYGQEAVSQLGHGKKLEFTVRIPDGHYDVDAVYSVIREHRNPDGTEVMEVLETERRGDKLTFKSDRFSTFTIVKAEMEDITEQPTAEPVTTPTTAPTTEPTPTAEPTQAPTPTVEPSAEPTQAPTPTVEPSAEPTQAPTPSAEPTQAPAPTAEPTQAPVPTVEPTQAPAPTAEPTQAPAPTSAPALPQRSEVEPTTAPTFVPVTYTVQRGDTLSLIAYKHGLTLRELLALNPQITNPNLIYCNQVIVVGMKQGTQEEVVTLVAEQYYTVEKGDSLYKIARKHKMTLRELTALNRALARQRYIYAGQRVKIK